MMTPAGPALWLTRLGAPAMVLAGLLLTISAAQRLGAGVLETGDSVLVIYNSRVEDSKAVATHYAAARHVPESQIIGLDLPTGDSMTRDEYVNRLQHPLAARLAESKLWIAGDRGPGLPSLIGSKIRYAALCYGVPFRVANDPTLKEPAMEKISAELRLSGCSVDGQLCLLPWGDKAPWIGFVPNAFYGVTNTRYMHPTNGLLLVTRLDGPSAKIASRLVDKAMEAETNGLWGRAYFDSRGLTNGPYILGDEWIKMTSRVARQLGFETVLDEKEEVWGPAFPMSHIAFYIGWYSQDAWGPFLQPTVEFMPGAFAYHLHSFSAQYLRDPSTRWVGPLLAKGATITMGCIDEPYLALTPEIPAFFGRLVFFGNTFGEAAYACQEVLSWQTVAIGDPLYRPFFKKTTELEQELTQRGSPLAAWSNLMEANQNIAAGADRSTVLRFLQKSANRHSPILQEKAAEIYLEQKRFNLAIETYEDVVKKADSPGQKLRAMHVLGDLRATYGPDQKAFEVFQNILKDFPDYAGKALVYQKLIPVARRLGKKEEEQRLTKELAALTGK
ncbi:MAG: TIGR03790 family protein [Verrucomicrobia bacterium]|nr:TIGR03790 family protein [Verrucomicrobiota bacterium]MBI3868900.1 TIGR03790 family protein [Verrucomicrobiota bacterium]